MRHRRQVGSGSGSPAIVTTPHRWLLVFGLVLSLTACSDPGRPEPVPSPSTTKAVDSRTNPPLEAVAVDQNSRLDVPVGGTPQDPLWIHVEPGDFSGPGAIGSIPVGSNAPSWPGFTPAGEAQEVTVTGAATRPVEIAFDAGGEHPDDIPVIWRKDAEVGWYPVAVGDPGATATAHRSHFSPHQPGWVDVEGWLGAKLDDAKRWALGRTTPPKCQQGPPWADLIEPTLDLLLTCVQPNTDDQRTRAELKAKNNRGMVREIAIPADVAYAAVEGQPESVRRLVRTVAGQRDVVLLPKGDELRVGFTQPAKRERDVELRPSMSALALTAELAVQLSDLAEERGSMAVLPALINVGGCSGLKSDLIAGVVPDSRSALENVTEGLFTCFGSVLADPEKAIAVAQHVVAASANVPLHIVKSDSAFRSKVEEKAGKLNLAGKIVRYALLARMAFIIWESNSEELGRAIADIDTASARLTLRPALHLRRKDLRSAPVPALCQHKAGKLVDGRLPELGDGMGTRGYEYIDMGLNAEGGQIAPVFHDFTGDGARDAAAVVHCSAGGVSWPDTVLFYGAKTTLLGWVDMSDPHLAEHADVTRMTVEGAGVRVNWRTTEGCCSDQQDWTARLELTGRRVRFVDAHRVG